MIKIKDVTFGNAVRLQNNKQEYYVSSDFHRVSLDFDPDTQLLHMAMSGKATKVIGLTNIKEMTLDEQTPGTSRGTKAKTKSEA